MWGCNHCVSLSLTREQWRLHAKSITHWAMRIRQELIKQNDTHRKDSWSAHKQCLLDIWWDTNGETVKFLEQRSTNYLNKKWLVRRSKDCWEVCIGRNFQNLVAWPVRRDLKEERNIFGVSQEGALTSRQALSCHHVPPRFMIMTVQWPMCSHTHDLISLLQTAISMLSNCYFPLLLHCLSSCIAASSVWWADMTEEVWGWS